MPVWAWIAIGAGVIAVIAVGVIVALLSYRRLERRYLQILVGQREELSATGKSLEGVVRRLGEASDDDLLAFADDPGNEERHVLAETARRAVLLTSELDTEPMPTTLVPAAEALADAAYVVAAQAGKVGPDVKGEAALDALCQIDLDQIRAAFAVARSAIGHACEACKFEDESLYGGGLYL